MALRSWATVRPEIFAAVSAFSVTKARSCLIASGLTLARAACSARLAASATSCETSGTAAGSFALRMTGARADRCSPSPRTGGASKIRRSGDPTDASTMDRIRTAPDLLKAHHARPLAQARASSADRASFDRDTSSIRNRPCKPSLVMRSPFAPSIPSDDDARIRCGAFRPSGQM